MIGYQDKITEKRIAWNTQNNDHAICKKVSSHENCTVHVQGHPYIIDLFTNNFLLLGILIALKMNSSKTLTEDLIQNKDIW